LISQNRHAVGSICARFYDEQSIGTTHYAASANRRSTKKDDMKLFFTFRGKPI